MKDGEFCPLIKKKCCQHKCSWYTQVRGTNPNTGQEIESLQEQLESKEFQASETEYSNKYIVENEFSESSIQKLQIETDSISKHEHSEQNTQDISEVEIQVNIKSMI